MPSDLEYQAMSKVVTNRNKNKKWVKRAKDPKYHVQNEDGTGSTHRTAHGEIEDGRGIVYPTIKKGEDGKLVEMNTDEARDNSFYNKEGVVLPTVDFAEYYSEKGYKESTGLLDKKTIPQNDLKPKNKMGYKQFRKGTMGFPNGRPKKKVKMYPGGTKGSKMEKPQVTYEGFDTMKINKPNSYSKEKSLNPQDLSSAVSAVAAMSGNEKVQKASQIANNGLSILGSFGAFRKGSKNVSTKMKYKCGTRGMKMKK